MFTTAKSLLRFAAVLALPITLFGQQIFVSNPELDKHVIYQDFSFFIPYTSTVYTTLATQASDLHSLGITDVWFAPPYRALNSFFEEGYAVSDRYDLGEFSAGHSGAVATKYGTSTQLRAAIASLHGQGLNAIVDIVPNQLFLQTQEAVRVTATDNFGHPINSKLVDFIYPGYTKGGGQGQSTYGLIKQWDHTLENGFSPQNLGVDRIMVDSSGMPYRYYGPGNSSNYLPAWLANSSAAASGALNLVDTYLSVDGYYSVTGTLYRPYLLYYVDPRPGVIVQTYLDYVRFATGMTGKSDDQVRQFLINASNALVAQLTGQYLAQQPGYSPVSETGITAFELVKPSESDVDKNVLQYEFLIGTDVDNSIATVQDETAHWQQFLLDQYSFDGFRFDAAGHYNTDILRQSAALMSGRYQSNIDNHLSVIESYVDAQAGFENSNRNGQLVYDADLYSAIYNTLEAKIANGPLSNIFTQSINAAGRMGTGQDIPNWSFVNNHDQEHNVAALIPIPGPKEGGAIPGTALYQSKQIALYEADRQLAVKQYAPYNVPAAYAVILTNKDTVPTVFYGDLYVSDQPYATVTTPYYNMITQILNARQTYVSGSQQITSYASSTSSTAGQDLISSVRFGVSRSTGIAVVIGDNPGTDSVIKVNMGATHTNQVFTNAAGTTHETASTDSNGMLSVHVVGTVTPQVHGYLGVFVPSSS